MLNEGYDLLRSLERCGVTYMSRHPDVGNPGKQEGLVVGIDPKGRVAGIEARDGESMARLWTTSEGNHNRFPVIQIQRPIWKVDPSSSLRIDLDRLKGDEFKKRQLLLRQSFELNVTSVEMSWWKRLHARATELLPLFETRSKEYLSLSELTRRFLITGEISAFLQGLMEQLRVHRDGIPYSLLENILIGNRWDKKSLEYRAEVPIALDLSDWGNYQARVASPKLERFASECLFKWEAEKIHAEFGISALSGKRIPLESGTFPRVTLPVVGNTYLFAVNDQTPCQTRHSKTGARIFPTGRAEAIAIQDALFWIKDPDRRDKTWCPVPGHLEDKPNLLIAYLAEKPNFELNKARFLGGVSSSEMSESDFAETAASIIDAYKAKHVLKASDTIRYFVIRQADSGRRQIVTADCLTVSAVVRAAEIWQEAAKNVPRFAVSFPGKKGETDRIVTPRCPFPADLVRITQRQWIRNGEDYRARVSGVGLGDVYDVFFERSGRTANMVPVLLGTTLRRSEPLLIGFGGYLNGNGVSKQARKTFDGIDMRFSAMMTVSALSIYLYKLGVKKEHYMKGMFFLTGRFLSLVDTLHFEYCKNVRKGSVPPQLLGNSCLHLALSNPNAAFSLLSQRLGIYQAWTRKEQDEKVKLARWAVGEMGRVAAALAEQGLPQVTNDADKAEILLGYLARSESRDESAPQIAV